MASECRSIKCKVYLTSDKSLNKPIDITAFHLPVKFVSGKCLSTHNIYIKQNFTSYAKQAFPNLGEHKVYHIDNEGDFVLISSNSELTTAIINDVEKFCLVMPASNSNDNDSNISTEETQKKTETDEKIHLKIDCIGCGVKNVKGKWYKCLECKDFNLCSACETKGIHPHHAMIRLSTIDTNFPIDKLQDFFFMDEKKES